MNVYLFAAVILLLPALCTALGAAGVFLVRRADEPRTRRMLCGMAAGIMLAASVWSLLLPAIERAEAGILPVWLAPAALYHHTFYDGHGGYPKNYPPCPADIKPIVDALTVADSLDAATDNIGRCYTMAKPVDTLLGEFHAQRGTRYAPEVVALLDDEEFSRDLKETLDETRKSVYLEVYHVKR